MSTAEIIAELPRISHRDRRQIILSVLTLEDEPNLRADYDRRSVERALMLVAMEVDDARKSAELSNLSPISQSPHGPPAEILGRQICPTFDSSPQF